MECKAILSTLKGVVFGFFLFFSFHILAADSDNGNRCIESRSELQASQIMQQVASETLGPEWVKLVPTKEQMITMNVLKNGKNEVGDDVLEKVHLTADSDGDFEVVGYQNSIPVGLSARFCIDPAKGIYLLAEGPFVEERILLKRSPASGQIVFMDLSKPQGDDTIYLVSKDDPDNIPWPSLFGTRQDTR